MSSRVDEKNDDVIAPAAPHSSTSSIGEEKPGIIDDGEIFKKGEGIEDFRTVSWVQTTVILLKCKLFFFVKKKDGSRRGKRRGKGMEGILSDRRQLYTHTHDLILIRCLCLPTIQ